MSTLDEGKVLQDVLENGMPCQLELRSYNDAISLQARLTKYLRKMNEIYTQGGGKSPFQAIDIILVKPQTLLFEDTSKVGLSVKSMEGPKGP